LKAAHACCSTAAAERKEKKKRFGIGGVGVA
jgi:hypothetical protein